MFKPTGNARRDYPKLTAEYLRVQDLLVAEREHIKSRDKTIKTLMKQIQELTDKYEEQLAEKTATIKELKVRLVNAEARLNHDGTNTGTPTSQTAPGKPKHIPNSRPHTGKPKGGEITDTVEHIQEHCPACGSTRCLPTGESEVKFEYDVRVQVVKVKHTFYYYRCTDCGKIFRSAIEPRLKEAAQYGCEVQAMILSLLNTSNMDINKVEVFLSGITGGELTPCAGYIAKLQKRGADHLVAFDSALRTCLIQQSLIYWDDTVIFINGESACMRFYGDEKIALYTAHEHKDLAGVNKDKILPRLTPDTTVMHDHNSINYNEQFCFNNIECNQHLQRDCQRNTDDTGHTWSAELKGLISTTIIDRKDAISTGEESFSPEYIEQFKHKVDAIVSTGWEQYKADNP